VLKTRVALSWSSGKDSAWSLHLLRHNPDIEVVALLTAFNATADRVAMHAVRRELVMAQAERIGLPLWGIDLPWPCSNELYEKLMGAACRRALDDGITAMAFGDLFLPDIRAYRERQLQPFGIQPLFPLWEIPTGTLADEMIRGGVKARVTCVDPTKLDGSFAGREFDAAFLRDLPPVVDSCGENGEFHSFVYDAPIFRTPIAIEAGEIVIRDGFVFADVIPAPLVAA
jgi:uncharacterized protein (TIGR00290 family)